MSVIMCVHVLYMYLHTRIKHFIYCDKQILNQILCLGSLDHDRPHLFGCGCGAQILPFTRLNH